MPFLGIDLGTSGLRALLVMRRDGPSGQRNGPTARADRSRAGRNRTRPTGSLPWMPRLTSCGRSSRLSRTCAASASLARCMAQSCWMRRMKCCDPASCGTTPARGLRRPGLTRCPTCARCRVTSSSPALPRRNLNGCVSMSRGSCQDRAGSASGGIPQFLPDRGLRGRHVRQRGDILAGCWWAALVRHPADGGAHASRPDASPGGRLRGSGAVAGFPA